jgi:glycosyltransferase involved in cell wall biosynthesis
VGLDERLMRHDANPAMNRERGGDGSAMLSIKNGERASHSPRPQLQVVPEAISFDVPDRSGRTLRMLSMNSPSLVSIIITNHNYQRFLPNAVASALTQTYLHVEVIVVDDGSTDDSRDIILSYGDRVIPVFQENRGQAAAFNAGFERCRGDIIIFLDADDALFPDTVERVVDTFAANGCLSKVQYRLEIIGDDDVSTGEFLPPAHLALSNGDLRRHALRFPDDLRFPPTSGNAFKASALRQILPVPESDYGAILADLYLLTLVPLFGEIASLQTPGAYYRSHESNNFFHRSLNLERTRAVITRTSAGHEYITAYADRIGLCDSPKDGTEILSVTYIANRLLSRKLEPELHPIREDSILELTLLGFRAVFRRFDLTKTAKLVYGLWFLGVALGPKRLSKYLGDRLLVQRSPNPYVWKVVQRVLFVS